MHDTEINVAVEIQATTQKWQKTDMHRSLCL